MKALLRHVGRLASVPALHSEIEELEAKVEELTERLAIARQQAGPGFYEVAKVVDFDDLREAIVERVYKDYVNLLMPNAMRSLGQALHRLPEPRVIVAGSGLDRRDIGIHRDLAVEVHFPEFTTRVHVW